MSLSIYKRVLDRDSIYRVKVFKFNRPICHYLVSSKEVNINLDMCNGNVAFTYSNKLVAIFILDLWRNKAS